MNPHAPACLNCERTDKQTPLISLQYESRQAWICPQCLPALIHHADELEDKLAALRQATLPNRAAPV
jgi:hypothetical protein